MPTALAFDVHKTVAQARITHRGNGNAQHACNFIKKREGECVVPVGTPSGKPGESGRDRQRTMQIFPGDTPSVSSKNVKTGSQFSPEIARKIV